ncbi:MAG TPA: porin family protein [Alphaproteobacteria bacterium]|nr:porin family protein [Alphaproteobacteria bacterium]
MGLTSKLVIAGLIVLAGASRAPAADAIAVPLADSPAQLPVHDSAGFDWNGFYAGVYGVGQWSPAGAGQLGLGVNAGVNAQLDFVLVGGEVALHGLTGGTIDTAYGQVLGRAGVLITDDVLLYAAAGYGVDLGLPAEDDLLLGGGVEIAVADDVSVRAQYLHGFPLSGANPKDQVTLGAHFHF